MTIQATITSIKGSYTGTLAECLALGAEWFPAEATLSVGQHRMGVRSVNGSKLFPLLDVHYTKVKAKNGLRGDIYRIDDEYVAVSWNDCSKVWLKVEALTDGTLTN